MRTVVIAHARPFVGPVAAATGAFVVVGEPRHERVGFCAKLNLVTANGSSRGMRIQGSRRLGAFEVVVEFFV